MRVKPRYLGFFLFAGNRRTSPMKPVVAMRSSCQLGKRKNHLRDPSVLTNNPNGSRASIPCQPAHYTDYAQSGSALCLMEEIHTFIGEHDLNNASPWLSQGLDGDSPEEVEAAVDSLQLTLDLYQTHTKSIWVQYDNLAARYRTNALKSLVVGHTTAMRQREERLIREIGNLRDCAPKSKSRKSSFTSAYRKFRRSMSSEQSETRISVDSLWSTCCRLARRSSSPLSATDR